MCVYLFLHKLKISDIRNFLTKTSDALLKAIIKKLVAKSIFKQVKIYKKKIKRGFKWTRTVYRYVSLRSLF